MIQMVAVCEICRQEVIQSISPGLFMVVLAITMTVMVVMVAPR